MLPLTSDFRVEWNETLNVPMLKTDAARRAWPENMPLYLQDWEELRMEIELTLIPYFAWANRGEGEMLVWIGKE